MIKKIGKQLKTAFLLLMVMTFLTGFIYPLVITGVAQLFFPFRSNGSLLEKNGKIIGSKLIGQFFEDPKYFWGRPSATPNFPYNAMASSGSNTGPSNLNFLSAVQNRVNALHYADPENEQLIPVDLVTASASGLDPEISPSAAYYQVHRVAKARGLSDAIVSAFVSRYAKKCSLGFLGEGRVNVLLLNSALDNLNINEENTNAST